MSLLIGGSVATLLGLVGFYIWWADFITIIKGGFPILLIFGGILAIYIGYDEIQDKLRDERRKQEETLSKAREEMEFAKAQAEQYREELEKLKEEAKKKEG